MKSLHAAHGRIRGSRKRSKESYLYEDSYWIVLRYVLLEINLFAAFGLGQAVYEELRAWHGTVVNISSVTSQTVLPNRLAYGTAKAALDQLPVP